ncbi:YsnF/AvaK domain-containing protein [Dyadobacter sandarakinus]|uniref:YsnF/AvaK domain-containing protein n=1 Tax=Dyadobacter sandarakinus TaxID=2747268 RepID=A0ABX7ICK1_9BACT|nr:YsnF/AvaK domain-containing protein [Dyadobacter sandarakinus]QRR03262.1 YsnF/AvaK domain-containing protein [Dyadobacter sandarakinus]
MSNTVVGIFEYEREAQQARDFLLASGFSDSHVDIKTASYKSDATTTDEDHDVVDRIGNFFRDLFDSDEEEANRYTTAGRRGTIVTVHAATAYEAENAAQILDQYGAIDLNQNDGLGSSSHGVADLPSASQPYTDVTTTSQSLTDLPVIPEVTGEESASLPVIEEELQVGKREIETGGVRLRSRIVERPVQESIRLRQEQVTVNRTPVDRVASESDFGTFQEGTIEMREYAEVPVVDKEARVVEEISLSKTVEEREEVIHETLRNTEVDVENLTDEERLRRSRLDL